MRVVVVEPLGQGGLIHYSYHMCRALSRHGVDVTLITSTDYELTELEHPFTLDRRLRLWNAREKSTDPTIIKKVRRVWRGFKYIREWLLLIRHLRQIKPDVVLFGEIRFGFEKYFLQQLKRSGFLLADVVHDVRMYDTSQQSDAILHDSTAHYQRYSKIYDVFDVLFVHDRTNYDLFLTLYDIAPDKVHEIPHGANEIMLEMTPACTVEDLRGRFGLRADEKVILFFGTVAKYKGIDDLIKAYQAVVQTTGARLVVAGFPSKDSSPDALHALAKSHGVDEAIVWWLDYIPNDEVVPLMTLADVVVLPYRAISQSGVVHVAYACGRPVVATRVGGLGDVVEDGASGLLVEPENIPALADGLINVLTDEELANAMGERALTLAQERYSWANVAGIVKRVMEAVSRDNE